MGEKKSIEGSDQFRKITVAYLFQSGSWGPLPGKGEDRDPDGEGSVPGYAPLRNLTCDDLRCALYWEVVHDNGSGGSERVYLAHEMAHALGAGPGHDDSHEGIMNTEPDGNDILFSPKSLAELREEFDN